MVSSFIDDPSSAEKGPAYHRTSSSILGGRNGRGFLSKIVAVGVNTCIQQANMLGDRLQNCFGTLERVGGEKRGAYRPQSEEGSVTGPFVFKGSYTGEDLACP